jgi:phosphomannomutase
VFYDGSWVLCRLSGTEPLVRIFAENKNGVLAQKDIDAFFNLISC